MRAEGNQYQFSRRCIALWWWFTFKAQRRDKANKTETQDSFRNSFRNTGTLSPETWLLSLHSATSLSSIKKKTFRETTNCQAFKAECLHHFNFLTYFETVSLSYLLHSFIFDHGSYKLCFGFWSLNKTELELKSCLGPVRTLYKFISHMIMLIWTGLHLRCAF